MMKFAKVWNRRSVDEAGVNAHPVPCGNLAAFACAHRSSTGIRWILVSLNSVSTDDAYVNGHVTFVAPRVAGQIVALGLPDQRAGRSPGVCRLLRAAAGPPVAGHL